MGERKGQNKYYPPDFDPKKHGNLNRYHGTHALRERARKLDKGIVIIRFEMPYNIWCNGCNAHIAMSVRYNAEKKKVGMYYSTPIYEFRMKCHLCDQYFEIRTDPANSDYVIMTGAKRKEQRWDMEENEQIVTEDKNDIKRLNLDPMFSLEHETIDKEKAAVLVPTLKELEEAKNDWKDDYALNSMLRKELRDEKKLIQEIKNNDKKFLDKWNINIDLVRENQEDVKIASLFKFNTIEKPEQNKTEKRKSIESESIFDNFPKKIADVSSEQGSMKNNSIQSLRQQLQKSSKNEKILNDGFKFATSTKYDKLTNFGIVVKKSDKITPMPHEPSTINNSASFLVSNDYGTSSDDEIKD